MGADQRPVVVGIDNSRGSSEAAEWGLAEARSRDVPLRLVYAYSDVEIYSAVYSFRNLAAPSADDIWTHGQAFVEHEAERLRDISPAVKVHAFAVDVDPVSALLDEARSACTVVLGSRHLESLGARVLGSVSTSVAARAACPVVVLRRFEPSTARNAGVVIGVRPGGNCEAAAAYAFEYASRWHIPVRVIMCVPPETLVEMISLQARPTPEDARVWLTDALHGWREKYPDLDVMTVVDCGHPVDALIAASRGRDLLVVGAHGRHPVLDSWLGSVTQGVLHHALSSVAVVGST